MSYEDAYLTRNQHLIFETGTERIDLTMRVNAGGWSMALGNVTQDTIEPLTREAVFRIEGPTDWAIQVAGMYYNDEIPKVRAVRSAKAAFALGKQFAVNPRGHAAPPAVWFLAGHVITEGIGVDTSGGILSVPAVTLREREPMIFGTDWQEKVSFASGTQNSSITYSGEIGTIDLEDDRGRPVLVYDLRKFTQYQNQATTLHLVLQRGTVDANDEISLQIPIPAANFRLDGSPGDSARVAQGIVAAVDLAEVTWSQVNAAGTAGSALSEWPTTGVYRVHLGATRVLNNSMDMGVGIGRYQVAQED